MARRRSFDNKKPAVTRGAGPQGPEITSLPPPAKESLARAVLGDDFDSSHLSDARYAASSTCPDDRLPRKHR